MYIFISLVLAMVWSLALPVCPRAEVVGHLLQVEGPVDLLKQGKVPALAPKVQDGLEPGDVIRTKTKGRAQVKFVDDSVLTIAPGSMVAIETYMYDGAKGSRKAVLQVFRGMVQTVVSRIFKTQEPDFIMKTHTAVLGVRGTKWYTLLRPNISYFFNELGRSCISNSKPEIKGEVCLNAMESIGVLADVAPLDRDRKPFSQHDLVHLQRMMKTGNGTAPPPGAGGGPPPFAFLDQLGLLNPQNPAGDPQSPLFKPPCIPHHVTGAVYYTIETGS
jgi:hypothetical protein